MVDENPNFQEKRLVSEQAKLFKLMFEALQEKADYGQREQLFI